MQLPPNEKKEAQSSLKDNINRFVKKQTRPLSARIEAIKRDIIALKNRFDNLHRAGFSEFEKKVAIVGLDNLVDRTYKALKDLLENIKNDKGASENKDLKKCQEQLDILSKKIKPILPLEKEQKNDSTIMIAGAGPVGYFSAITLLNAQDDVHKSNVVLVADKYAMFPVRGGTLNYPVIGDYLKLLNIDDQFVKKLQKYIILRWQGELSIKHLEMFGNAIYLAKGGKIIKGNVDWNKIKKETSPFPTVLISTYSKDEKEISVPNVKCVLNAMGFNAPYPANIKRELLEDKEEKQPLRSFFSQVNVGVPFSLYEKLLKISDYCDDHKKRWYFAAFFSFGYVFDLIDTLKDQSNPDPRVIYTHSLKDGSLEYIVKSASGAVIKDRIEADVLKEGGADGSYQRSTTVLSIICKRGHIDLGKKNLEGNYKVQLYPAFTKEESDLLDKVINERFVFDPGINDAQKNDMRIVLKTRLFLEFLGSQINIQFDDSEVMVLRDQIKSGKHLCSEFKIPNPSAPPQSVVYLADTKAVTTWVGAAALPPILNGKFIQVGIEHADAVIKHLMINKFTPEVFGEGSGPSNVFMSWQNRVERFVERQRLHVPDMSKEMKEYFEIKFNKTLQNKTASNLKVPVTMFQGKEKKADMEGENVQKGQIRRKRRK